MQINTSSADFCTKIEELQHIVNENKSQFVLISEANIKVSNHENLDAKKSQFADFKFEDKVIDNNEKARVSVMVH